MPENYKVLKCAVYLFINEAIEYFFLVNNKTIKRGVDPVYSNGTWGGVTGIVQTANNALTSIDEKKHYFTEVANNPATSDGYTASEAAIEALANKYDESTDGHYVTNPLNGSSDYIIDLRYKWKEYKADQSQCHLLYMQRSIYKDIVYPSMKNLKSVAEDVSQNSALSDAKGGIQEVGKFKTDINSYKSTLFGYLEDGGEYIDYVQLGYSIYFGAFLGCALFMLLGTGGLACCKCNGCRCFNQIGWCVFYLLMLLGFILSTAFFPLSVVLSEVCNVISLPSLRKGTVSIDNDAWNQVSTCLYGDGDLYAKYGLEEKISFAKDTLDNLGIVGSVYKDGSLVYNITDAYISKLTQVKDKEPNEAAKAIFSTNNVLQDLTTSNCKSDIMVWHSDDCGSTPILASPSDPDSSCVPVKSLTTGTFPSIVGNRYSACSEEITDKLKYLVKYSEDLTTVLTELIGDINDQFLTSLNTDNAGIKDIVESAYSLKNGVESDLSQLANSLRPQLNCTFLSKAYARVHLGLCEHFVPTFASLSLLIAIISGAGVFVIIFITCINRRWRLDKVHPEPGKGKMKRNKT